MDFDQLRVCRRKTVTCARRSPGMWRFTFFTFPTHGIQCEKGPVEFQYSIWASVFLDSRQWSVTVELRPAEHYILLRSKTQVQLAPAPQRLVFVMPASVVEQAGTSGRSPFRGFHTSPKCNGNSVTPNLRQTWPVGAGHQGRLPDGHRVSKQRPFYAASGTWLSSPITPVSLTAAPTMISPDYLCHHCRRSACDAVLDVRKAEH